MVRPSGKERSEENSGTEAVRKPIEELEKEVREQWRMQPGSDRSTLPPQLIVDYFSFEEVHSVLSRNKVQVLGAFDEMSSFYGQLDLFKHTGSTLDRKTLLSLSSGASCPLTFQT